jgi:hypothetical protein
LSNGDLGRRWHHKLIRWPAPDEESQDNQPDGAELLHSHAVTSSTARRGKPARPLEISIIPIVGRDLPQAMRRGRICTMG